MKVIAFYLPQFHTFPENDEWWGKGFTEWTNVKKAKQLFVWQYQPRKPYLDNYYDLDKGFKATMSWQIQIAKEHGLEGFCFYHYWFENGKKLMEKPIENFLKDKNLDMSFCLSWANEPWTRAWDGKSKQVIMPQAYGDREEWVRHFDYLLDFFRDDRYVKVDGKPMFLIYRIELIPNIDEMLQLWNALAIKAGFNGLFIVSQGSVYGTTKNKSKLINSYVLYEPGYTQAEFSFFRGNFLGKIFLSPNMWFSLSFQKLKMRIGGVLHSNNAQLNTMILDYDLFWKRILSRKYTEEMIPGAFVDWDNSPRRGGKGARIFRGSTPEKFEFYMRKLVEKVGMEAKRDIIFIDAWNEWAEGTYLEPDDRYGFQYLEALKRALI